MREKLLTEISNHITLGQWELAKACMLVYIQKDQEVESESENISEDRLNEIKDLLLQVGAHPLKSCIGSLTIPSPFHLSWLCATFLTDLNIDSKEVTALKAYADFHILLLKAKELNCDVPFEECSELFSANYDRGDNPPPLLSTEITRFIHDLIEKDAILAYFIDKAIEAPFINCTNTITSWLENQCLSINTLKQERKDTECEVNVRKILKVLSIQVSLSEDPPVSDNLYELLLDICSSQIASFYDVYKALIGNTAAIKKFCDLENLKYKRLNPLNSPEDIQELLHTAFISSDTMCLKEICLQTILNKTHFFALIMSYFIEMVKVGQFTLINKCLEKPLLSPFRPLLLLVSWDHISTLEDALILYKNLWHPDLIKNDYDLALLEACNKLGKEIEIISWCFEHFQLNPSAIKNIMTFKEISSMMRDHSFLYVINNCFNICKMKEEDIQDILKKVAFKTQKSKEKSVHFADIEKTNKFPAVSSVDLTIFQGYMILNSLMNAIYYSNQEDMNFSDAKRFLHSPVKDKNSLLENVHENEEPEPSKICENDVMINILKVKELLSKIYPLSYRIEILEAIFSLLFLTVNDLRDDLLSDAEYEDLREDSLKQTCNPNSSLTDSCENDSSIYDSSNKSQTDTDDKLSRIRIGSSASENTSPFSTCSSSSSTSMCNNMFLCSDKLLHKILLLLKECLMESSLLIESKQDFLPVMWEQFLNPEAEKNLDFKDLNLSINRLKQYVNEALWKYQLTTISVEGNAETRSRASDSDLCFYYLTENDKSFHSKKQQKSMKKTLAENSTSSAVLYSPKRRRSLRNRYNFSYAGRCQTVNCSHKTINFMLSSPQSLLNQCLLQNDPLKTTQVIKMFDLRNAEGAQEAIFVQEYPELVKQIHARDKQNQYLMPLSQRVYNPPFSSSSRSLSNIVSTATAGLCNISDAGVIDNLFSCCTIPEIPELSLLQSKITSKNFPQITECQDLRSLIMLDVMFSACPSLEFSANICSHALKRIRNSVNKTFPVSSSTNTLRGIGLSSFIQCIYDLIIAVLDRQTEEYHLYRKNIVPKYSSISQLLTETVDPLNSFDYTLMMDSLNSLSIALEDFVEKAEIVGILGNNETDFNSQQMVEANKSFRRLVNASSDTVGHGFLFLDNDEEEPTVNKKYPDYLKSFYIYIKQLAVLFNHCNLESEGKIFSKIGGYNQNL